MGVLERAHVSRSHASHVADAVHVLDRVVSVQRLLGIVAQHALRSPAEKCALDGDYSHAPKFVSKVSHLDHRRPWVKSYRDALSEANVSSTSSTLIFASPRL